MLLRVCSNVGRQGTIRGNPGAGENTTMEENGSDKGRGQYAKYVPEKDWEGLFNKLLPEQHGEKRTAGLLEAGRCCRFQPKAEILGASVFISCDINPAQARLARGCLRHYSLSRAMGYMGPFSRRKL